MRAIVTGVGAIKLFILIRSCKKSPIAVLSQRYT